MIGVGGVGGYIGGKLAAKFSENRTSKVNISFIARGEHLTEIKNNGLTLKSTQFDNINCKPDKATENIDELPTTDFFIIAVKGYDLDCIAKQIKNYVNNDTVILPLLNGADIYERLREVIKSGIILPACVYISSHVEKPGVINHISNNARVIFGKDPKKPEYTAENIISLFQKANIDFNWKDNPAPAIWEKYIFIASFALTTACYNKTIGEVLDDNSLKSKVINIMEEIKAIANKKDIGLSDDIIDKTLEKAASFSYNIKTSLQRDIIKNKQDNELDIFGGAIIRLGKQLSIETPVTSKIVKKLKYNRRLIYDG